MASAKQRGTAAAGIFGSPFSNVDFLKNDVIDMANYHEHSESNYSGQSQHNSMTLCNANRGCGLRFGAPLIECGEYDQPEFVGTDQLERGPRFEAPFQKCVMGTPNSAETLPERHRSTSGFGILARVAERFDVFLPVYNAAPPVTPKVGWRIRSGAPKGSIF